MASIKLEIGSDGIAIVTLDVPGVSMNVLSPAVVREMSDALDNIICRTDVKGVLLRSNKATFAAGWDLHELLGMLDARLSAHEALQRTQVYSQFLRRLETCGKPIAAAINGLALGGGLELALAAHHRVLAHDASAVIGFPEVKVGLLPGAGGTQRLPRLVGIEKSLPILLEGRNVSPQQALQLGIVHELTPAGKVTDGARAWLTQQQQSVTAPWDRKGFQVPGGSNPLSSRLSTTFTMASARVSAKTLHNLPAPAAILSAVFEGIQLPMNRALAVESRYFAKLATSLPARNLVRTLFVNKGRADNLARRPAEVPISRVSKVGILGAGMMGAGIAHVSAVAGIECVLLDNEQARADGGKQHVEGLLAKETEKGDVTQSRANQILGRIHPTTSYCDLSGCDLVVEAVFENREIKAQVTRQAEAVISRAALFASNTSTLPITGLAAASSRPAQFIGIHFFSPVHRMPLVEIIVGQQTSQETLARALDYVAQLRKTPIVVNDSRGFYTSRVFGAYCYEGQRMLEEGVAPALIENAGRLAGMPVGPLAVSDEVSLELQYRVIKQSQADLGKDHRDPIGWNVLRHFVEDLKRVGRKSGGGFYDYPTDGKKFLWPDLVREFPPSTSQPILDEVKQRLLYIQALESARCLEEGVLSSAEEADLGSVLGWGFPAFTGGTLSFIDTVGVTNFVSVCQKLAGQYGPRFEPTRGLLQRAKTGQAFHPKAPWPEGQVALAARA